MEQPVRRRPRRRKKTPNSKQLLIAGCVIGAVALIVAACIFIFTLAGGCGGEQPTRGDLKELTVGEFVREQETMVVRTSYADVAFPYAFSDLIGVEAVNKQNAAGLTFTVTINKQTHKLYTLWFNAEAGDTAGSFDLKDGFEPVRVSVVFYPVSEELSEDDRTTFKVTQETVNDVLDYMRKDSRFKEN